MGQDTILTKPMQRLERRLERPLGEVLTDLYHSQGMTLEQVAAQLGVTVGTVSRWMAALGIEARFPGQRGKPIGEPETSTA